MSQVQRLLMVLLDGQPHSSFDLLKEVYEASGPTVARLGARVADIKGMGYDIDSWQDKTNKKMWWYQLKSKSALPSEWSFNGELVK